MGRSLTLNDSDAPYWAISSPQAAAAASPYCPLRALAANLCGARKSRSERRSAGHSDEEGHEPRGSFQDFDLLFDQLEKRAVVELANPMPDDRHLPRRRLGSDPKAHNRALVGEPLS